MDLIPYAGELHDVGQGEAVTPLCLPNPRKSELSVMTSSPVGLFFFLFLKKKNVLNVFFSVYFYEYIFRSVIM